MSSMLKKIYILLYHIIFKHLPISYKRGGKLSALLRRYATKHIILECGENVNVEKGAVFSPNIRLGDNSGIGINCEILGKTTIGKNVMMGPECIIFTRNHEFSSVDIPMIQQGFQEEKECVIEDDVWIGRRVMIMPGVRIGKGSIIGAGAVVTKNIPEYTVAAGVPARIIRNRKKSTHDA